MSDIFKKWQASKFFTSNVCEYIDDFLVGPGFVYGDLSIIEVYHSEDEETYTVTIGNVIQHFPDLVKAEEYLWKWHAKDNCHTNYDDLSHLSTVEEVK